MLGIGRAGIFKGRAMFGIGSAIHKTPQLAK